MFTVHRTVDRPLAVTPRRPRQDVWRLRRLCPAGSSTWAPSFARPEPPSRAGHQWPPQCQHPLGLSSLHPDSRLCSLRKPPPLTQVTSSHNRPPPPKTALACAAQGLARRPRDPRRPPTLLPSSAVRLFPPPLARLPRDPPGHARPRRLSRLPEENRDSSPAGLRPGSLPRTSSPNSPERCD